MYVCVVKKMTKVCDDKLTAYSPVVTIRTDRFNIQKLLRSVHTVYLCVLCRSENKQRLFPYTALTDWVL